MPNLHITKYQQQSKTF